MIIKIFEVIYRQDEELGYIKAYGPNKFWSLFFSKCWTAKRTGIILSPILAGIIVAGLLISSIILAVIAIILTPWSHYSLKKRFTSMIRGLGFAAFSKYGFDVYETWRGRCGLEENVPTIPILALAPAAAASIVPSNKIKDDFNKALPVTFPLDEETENDIKRMKQIVQGNNAKGKFEFNTFTAPSIQINKRILIWDGMVMINCECDTIIDSKGNEWGKLIYRSRRGGYEWWALNGPSLKEIRGIIDENYKLPVPLLEPIEIKGERVYLSKAEREAWQKKQGASNLGGPIY